MTDTKTMLELADEYEAGLRKMEASGYENFGQAIKDHRMVIAALRAAAPSVPAGQTRVLEALQAWLGMQSHQNTSELYNEAAKFFGVDTAEFDPTEYDNVE